MMVVSGEASIATLFGLTMRTGLKSINSAFCNKEIPTNHSCNITTNAGQSGIDIHMPIVPGISERQVILRQQERDVADNMF
jgi:hypothetical protein